MCKLLNLHNTNKNFITDINSCFTEKHIKFNKLKKESMDLNKTQVKSPSEYKFICSKLKFYNFSIELILEFVKTEKKI